VIKLGIIDVLKRIAGQHRVGTVGHHALGTLVLEGVGGVAQGAGGVDDVIDQQAGAALYVADDVHHLGLVGLGAALVNDGKLCLQLLGHGAGAHDAANVGGHYQQVVVILALNVGQQDRRAVDVIHGAVKKALDLFGVEVDGQHPVDAHVGDHVGHYLGADGDAHRTHAAILAGIAKVGDHGGDARGRGAAQGIDNKHQFHQVFVGGRAGGLNNKNIVAAHVLADFNQKTVKQWRYRWGHRGFWQFPEPAPGLRYRRKPSN